MQVQAEAAQHGPSSIRGTLVALKGVGRTFRSGKAEVRALDDLELEVAPGEALGVVGVSGCGKSTLLELIGGLQEPDAGTVAIGGETAAAARRGACSYMPQRDMLLPWRDALDNAGLALEAQGLGRREARRRAEPLFERFGLEEFKRARPGTLSGGMRQRVAFMRTLLPGRPLLALDEPFAALDAITRSSMQQWLADALVSEPRTVVLVTHDVEEALFLCDRVVVMSSRPGHVVASFTVPLERPRDRTAAVTDPRLASLREQALEALR